MKSETVLKWLRTTALVLTMGIMVSNAQKTRFSKKKKTNNNNNKQMEHITLNILM